MARLGDVVKISSSSKKLDGEKFWLLNLDMVEQQTGDIIAYNYVSAKALNGSIIQFDADTILYSKLRPNLNKVVLPGVDGYATSEMLPLKPDTTVVCKEYLAVYLRSDTFVTWAVSKTAGAKMPRLGTKELLGKEIPLPPLVEQQKIANCFFKLNELISLSKQQLAKLDELVKARFVEMFGECEEHKRLEDYASLITKGASPKWQGVDYCEEGTLFVTSENVREGYLDLSKKKYLDDKINEIQPRSILKRNDILINIVGASIGRAAVYTCDEIANINQAVALVRVDYSEINRTYLLTFLNSPQAIEMYGKMKKGGARDNLSLQNIADLQIPVAPVELQNQFATFVERTDKSKLAVQKSLDELETLKKALMQKYFG